MSDARIAAGLPPPNAFGLGFALEPDKVRT
jgi:hypothetical protein